MTCPHCGSNSVGAHFKFCQNCGTELASSATNTGTQQQRVAADARLPLASAAASTLLAWAMQHRTRAIMAVIGLSVAALVVVTVALFIVGLFIALVAAVAPVLIIGGVAFAIVRNRRRRRYSRSSIQQRLQGRQSWSSRR